MSRYAAVSRANELARARAKFRADMFALLGSLLVAGVMVMLAVALAFGATS